MDLQLEFRNNRLHVDSINLNYQPSRLPGSQISDGVGWVGSHEQVGPWSPEGGLQLPGWRPDFAVNQRKLNLRIVELLGVVPLAELEVNCCRLNDLDAGWPHAVTGSHLIVHLLHGTIKGGITVLLVHVVVPSPALVTQPDAIVLDCGRVTLKDLWKIKQVLKQTWKRKETLHLNLQTTSASRDNDEQKQIFYSPR